MQGFEFTPCIEPHHPGTFITERMYGAVKEGRMQTVPLMMGVVSEEMLSRAERKSNVHNISTNLENTLLS